MNEFEIAAKIPNEPVGWLETKLSKTVMMRLQSYITTAKKNPINWNRELVGNISKSLLLEDKDDWFFQTILIPLIGKFTESYPSYMSSISIFTEDAPYCLNKLWVNFQKKHEFNPLHNHSGVFSFVIWVKIPTDWREQHALPISVNSNKPSVFEQDKVTTINCSSNFEFQHFSMLGNPSSYQYFLDKKSEGLMLFFPAKLQHTVYPFYNCDKERISISGNISFNTSENAIRQYRSHQKAINV